MSDLIEWAPAITENEKMENLINQDIRNRLIRFSNLLEIPKEKRFFLTYLVEKNEKSVELEIKKENWNDYIFIDKNSRKILLKISLKILKNLKIDSKSSNFLIDKDFAENFGITTEINWDNLAEIEKSKKNFSSLHKILSSIQWPQDDTISKIKEVKDTFEEDFFIDKNLNKKRILTKHETASFNWEEYQDIESEDHDRLIIDKKTKKEVELMVEWNKDMIIKNIDKIYEMWEKIYYKVNFTKNEKWYSIDNLIIDQNLNIFKISWKYLDSIEQEERLGKKIIHIITKEEYATYTTNGNGKVVENYRDYYFDEYGQQFTIDWTKKNIVSISKECKNIDPYIDVYEAKTEDWELILLNNELNFIKIKDNPKK